MSKLLATFVIAHVGCAFGQPQTATVYRTSTSGGAMSANTESAPQGDGLLRVGLIMLGTSWLGTVVTGQIMKSAALSDFDRMIGGEETVDRLWLPVYGAWSGLIHNETTVRDNCTSASGIIGKDCSLVTVASASIGVAAVVQTVGLGLTIAGLVEFFDTRSSSPAQGQPRREHFVLVPSGPEGVGATVVGRF